MRALFVSVVCHLCSGPCQLWRLRPSHWAHSSLLVVLWNADLNVLMTSGPCVPVPYFSFFSPQTLKFYFSKCTVVGPVYESLLEAGASSPLVFLV